MSVISLSMEIWEFNRGRTLATLDDIAKQPDPQAVLAWRPGPGRAHIAWQLMHIGITEELFATARLRGAESAYPDLVPRFRGGSTPDDDIPQLSQIREILAAARGHLRETVSAITESDLSKIPEGFKERGWPIRTILQIIGWHEAHHQGQAHITLNLWKAAHR